MLSPISALRYLKVFLAALSYHHQPSRYSFRNDPDSTYLSTELLYLPIYRFFRIFLHVTTALCGDAEFAINSVVVTWSDRAHPHKKLGGNDIQHTQAKQFGRQVGIIRVSTKAVTRGLHDLARVSGLERTGVTKALLKHANQHCSHTPRFNVYFTRLLRHCHGSNDRDPDPPSYHRNTPRADRRATTKRQSCTSSISPSCRQLQYDSQLSIVCSEVEYAAFDLHGLIVLLHSKQKRKTPLGLFSSTGPTTRYYKKKNYNKN